MPADRLACWGGRPTTTGVAPIGAQLAEVGPALHARGPTRRRRPRRGQTSRSSAAKSSGMSCGRWGRAGGRPRPGRRRGAGRQAWRTAVRRAVASRRRQGGGGPALADLAHALEGLGVGRRGRRAPRTARPDRRGRAARGPSKISSSSTRGRNGARTRSMKQHLSHSPHQRSRRRAGSIAKARLQLWKTRWYSVERGEALAPPTARCRGAAARSTRRPSPSAAAHGRREGPSRTRRPFEYWWLIDRPSDLEVAEPTPTTRWT